MAVKRRKESKAALAERTLEIIARFDERYPEIGTFLTHKNPFELLIAVILSAQCTDARVNLSTPALFEAFPTPKAMADAPLDDLKFLLKSINFFNTKAKNIQATAAILHHDYQDEVPADLDQLVAMPGVGRKTANVVLGQAFGIPGITADTHVQRVSRRLGWTQGKDATAVEKDLMNVWPKANWIDMSSQVIVHGRETCDARKPRCASCFLLDLCPSAQVEG